MKAPPVTAEYMRDWARHAHGSPLYAELCEVVARGWSETVLGQGHPHGEWVEFYARP